MHLRFKLDQHTVPVLAGRRPTAPSPHPYYVVAPPFTRTSAGIKVLHLLCDTLNHLGCEAYMVIHPGGLPNRIVSSSLDTPVLTRKIARRHFRDGRTPVLVYPETVTGNPFRAPVVCRYVLNYPGLLGGDTAYAAGEMVYGYSHRLAAAAGVPDQVLFLPASDPDVFHPPASEGARSGACFYASKYREVHGGDLLPVTSGAFEITRDKPNSLSPLEIAELFRRSEVFYCYENTSLATEAAMCGCPAVFLPNEHLTEIIASEELGSDGFAWGDGPEEIARARATVGRFYDHYRKVLNDFGAQLASFVQETQVRAAATAFDRPLNLSQYSPVLGPSLLQVYIARAVHLIRTAGPWETLMRASKYGLNLMRQQRQPH